MKRLFHISMLVLVLCSCSKEPVRSGVGNSVVLRFCGLQEVENVQTKATELMPAPFSASGKGRIGIFVCDHHDGPDPNPYTPFAKGMNNIKALLTSSELPQTWTFALPGYTDALTELVLTEKEDADENNVTADIFAYYPYDDKVTTPECIPFSVGLDIANLPYAFEGQVIQRLYRNLLYAEENKPDNTDNKAIDPTAVSEADGSKLQEVDVNLTFKQALSLIEINIAKNNPNYNPPKSLKDSSTVMVASKVLLVRNNGYLYSGGKFNAIDGSVYELQPCDSLVISYQSSNGGSSTPGTKFNQSVVVPTRPGEDYQDDDYTFLFTIDGVKLPTVFNLKRAHRQKSVGDILISRTLCRF